MTPNCRYLPILSSLLFVAIIINGCGNGRPSTDQGNTTKTESITNATNDTTNTWEQESSNHASSEQPPNETGITGKKKRNFETTSGQRDPESDNQINSTGSSKQNPTNINIDPTLPQRAGAGA